MIGDDDANMGASAPVGKPAETEGTTEILDPEAARKAIEAARMEDMARRAFGPGFVPGAVSSGATSEAPSKATGEAPSEAPVVARGDPIAAALARVKAGDKGAHLEEPVARAIAKLSLAGRARWYQAFKMAGGSIGPLRELVEEVEASHEASGKASRAPAGSAVDIVDLVPWHEAVDGEALIADMVAAIRRHVVLSEDSALAVALWLMHGHALDEAAFAPRLVVWSPIRRCGKTRLLEVISHLAARALPASSITRAAIARVIDENRPTLLIDEADTTMGRRADPILKGIVNSGHSRAQAYRLITVGGNGTRRFSTFAMMAIGIIGRTWSELEDRSIAVAMKRRRQDEPIARLDDSARAHLDVLGRQAARWAADNKGGLGAVEPPMPPRLLENDRAADNWRLCLAIADKIGEWPAKARAAAEALTAEAEDAIEDHALLLLRDLHALLVEADKRFGAPVLGLGSQDAVKRLRLYEDRPWPDFGTNGAGLTERHVGQLLRPFGVKKTRISHGGRSDRERFWGFRRDAILDAFRRYVPQTAVLSGTSGTRVSDQEINGQNSWDTKTRGPEKNGEQAIEIAAVSQVSQGKTENDGVSGEKGEDTSPDGGRRGRAADPAG